MSRNKKRNRGKKKQQQKQKQHYQKYPQPAKPLAVATSAGLMPVAPAQPQKQTNQNQSNKKKKDKKPNKVYARRIVPLSQWKRFENFMERLPTIEGTLGEIHENWRLHLSFLRDEFGYDEKDMVEITDCIELLFDLFAGVDKSSQRPKPYAPNPESIAEKVSNRPWQKYDNMIAEILIEDISDGNL
jgi:hypothetical protein